MSSDLFYYLSGILIISLGINFTINKFYCINKIKLIIFTIISIFVGVLCSNVMNYIESGNFGGTSFYGAIFFMPIYVILFSFIFKVNLNKLLNLTAFLGMITSMILKIRCFNYGCCGGRKIPIVTEHGYAVFPSQLAEAFFAFIVLIILIILFKKNKDRTDLYPMMMAIYGIGRLNLNTFRLYKSVFLFLANGHIWSIVSIIIGFIWLFIIYEKKKRTV